MKTQELNSVIQNINNEYSTDEAYIGFFYGEENEFSSYVKANKEGLMLYAN
ncbi:hypothetical protein L3X37_10325 [Sabulilitoribacter arenilitoris]|uniref:Uncharacterized protein n=1 Tax=Wocania arenilitoris TaxID=2044858 RepID=A0AAE3JNK1_9FLAO|nr:hypothetical protein [Wocania arenilitoris]MCF7568761.1 hypothetical protein [Wocania arenilitoris]